MNLPKSIEGKWTAGCWRAWAAQLTVFALLFVVPPAFACVGCREPGSETLNHESPTVMAGLAFSWSVLFMLGFAFLVVSLMSTFIWRTCVRIERERDRS